MAERELNRIIDGFTDLTRGIDSSRPPNLIERNAAAFGINISCRGGFPSTRPKYLKRTLTFPDQNTETAFKQGRMQGAGIYLPSNTDPLHIVSVEGRIYSIDIDYNVLELTTATDYNAPDEPIAYMVQAEQYWITQNNLNKARVYDGASFFTSDPNQQGIPVGGPMAYGQGRLAVAANREVFFGDISGGPTRVIDFTESSDISIGGSWTVGLPGPITALAYIAVIDAATGQGELTIHTPYGVTTMHPSRPRATWRTTAPFQTVAVTPFGAMGQGSVLDINSDLWFRARDGIRSLQIVLRNFEASWLNTPQSQELDRVTAFDDPLLVSSSQALLFDNRLLMTVSPRRLNNIVYHMGLASLDFDPMSTLFDKTPPHYDGIWTGLKITKLVKGDYSGQERAFAWCLDSNNENCLWEIMTQKGDDNDTKPIDCTVESAAYFFENPREAKQLDAFETHVDELSGTVSFTLSYRPDQYPLWYSWKGWSVCAPRTDCTPVDGCSVPRSVKKQYRPRLWVGTPPQACVAPITVPANLGYQFQVLLKWSGVARIKMAFLHALKTEENPYGRKCLSDAETCTALEGCDENIFAYTSE